MFSSQADLKRPYAENLPTPHQMAEVFKRAKLLDPAATPLPPYYLLLAHCVPADIVPVVGAPFSPQDFFVDINEMSTHQKLQMAQVLEKFPPPLAPATRPDTKNNTVGMMIPFVYPPIPVLRPDRHVADPVVVKRRGRKLASQLQAIAQAMSNAKLPSRVGLEDADIYPVMAPLPFPPPNYMPYPLLSDNATLTPNEVFSGWITALEHLPRTDMVVASAAGSIFDLRAQAEADGLTIAKLDRLVELHRQESDPEAEDDRSDSEELVLESGFDEYVEYADQIDTSNAEDPYAVDKRTGTVVVDPPMKAEFEHVAPMVSSRGRTSVKRTGASFEYSDRDIENQNDAEFTQELALDRNNDVVNATGAQRAKRRVELLQSFDQIRHYASSHRDGVYASKKLELLARLRTLQQSHISFSDEKTVIHDDTLARYVSDLQGQRDIEFLRLKFYQRYEKLKTASAFYQTSNKAYKSMNALIINKLQKLKHFFEFQRQLFRDGTNPKTDSDLLNIRSKESAKLYNGFTENDYLTAIKEVFRASVLNEDQGLPRDSHPDFDPDAYRKVFTDREHLANVHDMMPLVTEEEFKLIVGDAPQKSGPAKDYAGKPKSAWHPIFQSPLYDRVTSGSDTNASDGGAPTFKRRPGRRAAPKPVFGEAATKQNTEAALVAKIMKQFIGPAGANAEELTDDLELIGITTRWPVK